MSQAATWDGSGILLRPPADILLSDRGIQSEFGSLLDIVAQISPKLSAHPSICHPAA
jgi:hypothetical protein